MRTIGFSSVLTDTFGANRHRAKARSQEFKEESAEHWVKMNLPARTNGPTSLVLDPSAKGRMYLTAWGVGRLAGDTEGVG